MKNNVLKGLLVIFATVFTGFAQAQTVSGKVSDASGPLPSASVVVKGTTTSTQTDLDGKYTIKAGADATLVFSFIGLKTQAVSVGGKSTINVTMQSDDQQLKDVVVIGYGSVKKKDATGAIDQISSKNFDNVAATSPAQLLRGKMAGVQVTSASGEPGAGMSIRVRGAASFRSGSNALIVVDGVPLDGGNISSGGQDIPGLGTSSARNPLNFINQNDIESISVLKDASSTAIYGSRGANGVIMITTKKGKSSKPELTYSTSVQFGSYKSNNFKMLDGPGFLAAGGTNKSGSYNWEDAILRSSFSTNHDISFTKSSENSSTRLSIGATNSEGIVKNTGIDKYSIALYNSNEFLNGKVKIEARVAYTNINDKTTLITNNPGFVGNLISNALTWNPTRSVYDASGNYAYISETTLNPVEILNSYNDRAKTNKILASLNTTVKLTNNLKYQFLIGVDNSNSNRKNEILPTLRVQGLSTYAVGSSTIVTDGGLATVQNQDNFNKTFEHTLNYNKNITDKINLDAVVGYSYYDYNSNGSYLTAKRFNVNQTNLVDNLEGGIYGNTRPGSFKNRTEIQSFFTRANVTLFDKYVITGTIRRDGSSKLGDSNKYGNFPSLGFAYKAISNKEGMINDLKLRLNHGTTGNSEFIVNSAIEKTEYVDGAQKTVNNGNKDLKWETTISSGFGLDFELLKNRLSGSFDYFTKDTKDLIIGIPSAASMPGAGSPRYFNEPSVILNAKGIELSLNYKVIQNENFRWEVSGNVSTLQTEIKDLKPFIKLNTGELNGQGLSGAFSQQLANGYPMYSYFLQEFTGYNAAGVSQYDAAGPKFVNKQALPKMNVGFSTTLAFKGVDLTASFYGAYGHYIYNNTANALFFRGALPEKNVSPSVAASVQASGDSNAASTKYLEKGDFLRMGNLTIGYNFKSDLLEKIKIKSARFYVNGSNLLLFTDYTGFDPEVDINKSMDGVPSSGIDFVSYPKEKNIAIGLNLTF
jgi:iron complex outermembrane receptor protein